MQQSSAGQRGSCVREVLGSNISIQSHRIMRMMWFRKFTNVLQGKNVNASNGITQSVKHTFQ